jgi:hypothetical protein
MHGIHSLERSLLARFAARLATVGAVSVAMAFGGLTHAALAAPTPPRPQLAAYGQGGGAIVYGWNFKPGATVRVVLLDAGLQKALSTEYVNAISTGAFDVLAPANYIGDVWVAADSPGVPTVWAKTHVFSDPHLDTVAAPTQCGTVAITGTGYYPGGIARVELLDPSLNVIDRQYVTATTGRVYGGAIRTTLDTHGYVGTAFVVTDGDAPAEGWAQVSTCRT